MGEIFHESKVDKYQSFELPSGKKYHVFISYATTEPDKQVAENLYTILTNGGYKCCLHEIDFKAGRLIQDNIGKCMKKSVKIIAILSDNFKNSFWCSVEMNAVVALHKENRGFPPIILKLDNCEVPEACRLYTYMSLNRGLEEKMEDILDAINNMEVSEFPVNLVNIPFVPIPCINYNHDQKPHSPCIWPHICAKFILSDITCNGKCDKSHEFDKESLDKLRKCGFPVDIDVSFLLRLYRDKCRGWLKNFPTKTVCGPCFYYNNKGCFIKDICPFTHICNDWFIGNCRRKNCPFSHDLSNEQTTSLLEKFGINTNHPDDIILWQYRERCQNYSELKIKQSQDSTSPTTTNSFSNISKHGLYVILGAITLTLLFDIFYGKTFSIIFE